MVRPRGGAARRSRSPGGLGVDGGRRGRAGGSCVRCAYGPGAARASARPGNQHDKIIMASLKLVPD